MNTEIRDKLKKIVFYDEFNHPFSTYNLSDFSSIETFIADERSLVVTIPHDIACNFVFEKNFYSMMLVGIDFEFEFVEDEVFHDNDGNRVWLQIEVSDRLIDLILDGRGDNEHQYFLVKEGES
ncbi:MAG: hypothetical protein ACOCRX_07520 [Candidatus Woesearchaeota archaeon]